MSIYKRNLVQPKHMARSRDPESSHLAARHMVESGAQNAQQQVALDLVRKHPGHASDELAKHGLLDRYQLARRLPELEKAGLVVRGNIRKSQITVRMATTWYASLQDIPR